MKAVKVFVYVKNNEVKCYHNLLQLTQNNHLSYSSVQKALQRTNTILYKDSIIAKDKIEYKTRRKPNNLR